MSIYYHFTCTKNRESIKKNGLKVGEDPTTDIDSGKPEFLYFIKMSDLVRGSKDFEKKFKVIYSVICIILSGCKSVDLWEVSDINTDIIDHSLPFEFKSPVDIPASQIKLIPSWPHKLNGITENGPICIGEFGGEVEQYDHVKKYYLDSDEDSEEDSEDEEDSDEDSDDEEDSDEDSDEDSEEDSGDEEDSEEDDEDNDELASPKKKRRT